LKRPDVERDGVFLVSDGQKLRGYLVAGSSGNIWEFCVSNDDEEVARTLLCEALKYLEKFAISSVNVNVPLDSGLVESLREVGFSAISAERMFVTTLSPEAIVQVLASSRKERLASRFDDEFGFRLRDVPYGVRKEFSVEIRSGALKVSEGFSSKPSVVVELGFMDLLSILFEGSSAWRLFLARKISVRPFRKLGAALSFLSAIRLRGLWFFPLSDYG
jgi:hypothetical protein